MFCSNCGNKLPENAQSCMKCGRSVQQPGPPNETVMLEPPPNGMSPDGMLPNGMPPNETMMLEPPSASVLIEQMPGEMPPVKREGTPLPAGSAQGGSKAGVILALIAGTAVVAVIAVIAVMTVMLGNKRYYRQTETVAGEEADEELDGRESSDVADNEPDGKKSPDVADSEEPKGETQEEGAVVKNPKYARELTSEEAELQSRIAELNKEEADRPTIRVYEDNYSPGERNASASWNSQVFYVLEGYETAPDYQDKNLCSLKRRQLWNAENGNAIEYEIYMNPYTDKPNKIVGIEYQDQGLEVAEYYYTNEGKVSFIFLYHIDNYVSTYATPDKAGERFLFSNDSLLTWRVVQSGTTTNYAVGQAEADRMRTQYDASTIRLYDSLDQEQKTQFDQAEKRMVNAAYNTYQKVMNTPGLTVLQGYVDDMQENGIENADVTLCTTDFEGTLFEAKTDAEGKYAIYVPDTAYAYNICMGSSGYQDCEINGIQIENEQIEANQNTAYLVKDGEGDAEVALKLGDALNYAGDGQGMVPLSGALVKVRRGINNRSGEVYLQETAAEDGSLMLNLPAGVYTLEIIMEGYESMYYCIVANPYHASNFYEFYASPMMDEGEYRIVLTWGETPRDLDSHLFTVVGGDSTHIWFGQQNDAYGNDLDVDDTSSYGPETVSIRQFERNNYYKYCVADYSNLSSGMYDSFEMSNSGVSVNVYSSDGLAASFHVPVGQAGTIWEVFEIRNGVIQPIERYYRNVEDKGWWDHE